MAKRFTDTNKYKKPFIRGLKAPYKLLWDYLYHDCDHAGIWIVDFDIAQIYIGKDALVDSENALKNFNKDEMKIIEIDGGKKWFIPSFIDFQYGVLNPSNRAHLSVIRLLDNYNLLNSDKELIRPLQGYKDKDKDKDKVKDMDMVKEKESDFENFEVVVYPDFSDFWDLYDKKVGKKEKVKSKWDKLSQETKEKIMLYIPNYKLSESNKKFRKHPETFLNNESWNDEIIIDHKQNKDRPAHEFVRQFKQAQQL